MQHPAPRGGAWSDRRSSGEASLSTTTDRAVRASRGVARWWSMRQPTSLVKDSPAQLHHDSGPGRSPCSVRTTSTRRRGPSRSPSHSRSSGRKPSIFCAGRQFVTSCGRCARFRSPSSRNSRPAASAARRLRSSSRAKASRKRIFRACLAPPSGVSRMFPGRCRCAGSPPLGRYRQATVRPEKSASTYRPSWAYSARPRARGGRPAQVRTADGASRDRIATPLRPAIEPQSIAAW